MGDRSASSPAARAPRRVPRPPWWLVVIGSLGLAFGMLVGFRNRRIEAATNAFHDLHGAPGQH